MSHDAEIDRYVKDPSLLVDLCREVVERLDVRIENDETVAMDAQLREIARAIDKLDKQGVPTPDVLRSEKTRLAAALGENTEAMQTLNHLTEELDEFLADLKLRVGRTIKGTTTTKTRSKRSKAPKTKPATFRKLIVDALKVHGGRAASAEVVNEVGERLKGKLLPGDLEVRQDGKTLAWQNNVCWQRFHLIQDGILKADSPRGIWELS